MEVWLFWVYILVALSVAFAFGLHDDPDLDWADIGGVIIMSVLWPFTLAYVYGSNRAGVDKTKGDSR